MGEDEVELRDLEDVGFVGRGANGPLAGPPLMENRP
jgi:hypothetical protein